MRYEDNDNWTTELVQLLISFRQNCDVTIYDNTIETKQNVQTFKVVYICLIEKVGMISVN